MQPPARRTVEVFVDPSCPFAWITEQWLTAVEQLELIDLKVRLLSLSVVNDGRDIDDWYRGFNDAAWGPARVMAAIELQAGNTAARRFYAAYGRHFHVELDTADEADRLEMSRTALERADLAASFIDAATDHQLDEVLRAWTRDALAPVGLDVGVPITVIDGVASSGPVLARIPRGQDAVDMLEAVVLLSRQSSFVKFERQRIGSLDVG